MVTMREKLAAYNVAKLAETKATEMFKANPTPENEVAMLESRSIVVLVIAIYLLAALIPAAISGLNNASTDGWNTTQIAIWGVVSIIILATIIMKISE